MTPSKSAAVDWKSTEVLIGIVQVVGPEQVDLPVTWTVKLQVGSAFPVLCGNSRASAERSSMLTERASAELASVPAGRAVTRICWLAVASVRAGASYTTAATPWAFVFTVIPVPTLTPVEVERS